MILKQVLIVGGSGLIGSSLARRLKAKGYKVVFLGRKISKRSKGVDKYEWDISRNYIDTRAFEKTEIIINLAGAGVVDKRWSSSRKKDIHDSRVLGTRLLVDYIKKHGRQVKTFISASAIGYYGNRMDEILFEDSYPGEDFLAKTCVDWEKEAERITHECPHIRLGILRIGLVLSARGGYFEKIKGPVKWGLGAAVYPGDQFLSWIHMEDLCQMFIYLIEEEKISGIFNAVSNEPVNSDALVGNIAHRYRKPYFLPPVPLWLLRFLFGDLAHALSASQYVNSEKIRENGFQFKYPDLNTALNNLILE